MKKQTRVRIAPSPTGYLHIGTARTALFNWLFTKHEGGKFILRIEDTDLERSAQYYEEDIIESLRWLGFQWDEFYKQSDRISVYSKYIKRLLNNGKAFWCYHSKEELEQEQKEQRKNKQAPKHFCEHKTQNPNSRQGIIRLAVDENSNRKIKFDDIIRGKIEFEEKLLGDISIAKDEKTPLYNFAVAVDDHETKISHVIRGEDHIANTPKQILIQKALGFDMPEYAHLPLILGPDRSKLSKRHGATSVMEYKKLGYLPDAMINFMALLGFRPETNRLDGDKQKEDIFTGEKLAELFDLKKVHKAGAVFDIKKLDWMNGEYIKKLSDEELEKTMLGYMTHNYHLTEIPIPPLLKLVRERIKKFSDLHEFDFFLIDPEYEKGLLRWKNKTDEEIKRSLEEIKKIVEETGTDNQNKLRGKLDEMGKRLEDSSASSGQDRGLVYWPFRVALSGKKGSPDPVDIAAILGKDKTLKRIDSALEKLK